MCRCCQSCWEDIYWNCIEEKYCYDETIANYNPEDDENVPQKAVGLSIENSLKFPTPITTQPKTTKDDEFRREIQTNGNILAPEILAVFKNSLIFKEQPKIFRSTIRGSGIHRRGETDEQKLIKRLEAPSDSSPPQSKDQLDSTDDEFRDEVVLRPKFKKHHLDLPLETIHQRQPLRNVQSVPHLNSLDENTNKVFTISHAESMSRISMTPEVPSISFASLPKNYEDTPTIEKFRTSTSLYSIQTANEAKATEKEDFSMPRYYRKSDMVVSPSTENFKTISEESLPTTSRRQLAAKSQRLQIAKLQLPPLQIRHKKDDSKNIQ